MIILAVLATAVVLSIAKAPGPTAVAVSYRPLDCGAVARQAVRSTGGRLLSVHPRAGKCVVSILTRRGSGRPHKVILQIDPKTEKFATDRKRERR